jgi:hypothetical protein
MIITNNCIRDVRINILNIYIEYKRSIDRSIDRSGGINK